MLFIIYLFIILNIYFTTLLFSNSSNKKACDLAGERLINLKENVLLKFIKKKKKGSHKIVRDLLNSKLINCHFTLLM